MGVVALLIAVLNVRRVLINRRLSERVSYELLPTTSFDPSSEDVLRFANQVARTRPSVWSGAPAAATAVRVRLTTRPDGQQTYVLEGHLTSTSVLRHQSYPHVEIRQCPAKENSPSSTPADRRVHVARAELVLAKDSDQPLRAVPLRPDPLQALAAAVCDVRQDLGERVDVCLDLLPLTAAKVQHLRHRGMQHVRSGGDGLWHHAAASLTGGYSIGQLARLVLGTTPVGSRASRPRRTEGRDVPLKRGRLDVTVDKLSGAEPVFVAQVLIRAESEIPGRAEAHLHQMLAAMDQWRSGQNWWRVAGPNLRLLHIGADSWPRRRGFDRRFRTGEFSPRKQSLVTPSEVGGLLKPATRHCAARNVARSGGLIPPAPRELTVYRGQPDLLPLGFVRRADGGQALVGAPLDETLFSLRTGKAGCGKTELALVQAVALARSGHGVWFLDPHRDGWERAKPYLCRDGLYQRVWEIDLTLRNDEARQCGWNPLSMHGKRREHIYDQTSAVVTGIASALAWGDGANRAQTILTKACESLCELGLKLPADLQPTLFQIRTLLQDEDWRMAIMPHLSGGLKAYWATSFRSYSADAIPVVTNVIERLAASPALRAFLGQPQSTYDARRALDTGRVVMVCPQGTGTTDRIVTCLLIFDLFNAALSRRDLPAEQRRPFHAFVDELTVVDGAARGTIAAIVEQLRKFGVRGHFMTQMASRLSATTRTSLLQNQSILATSTAEIDAAKTVTRQWGNIIDPNTVVQLEKYHHIVSVTMNGRTTEPFLIRGPQLGIDLFGEDHHPERIPVLDAAIDTNLRRRRIQDVTEELDQLDNRIKAQLGPAPALRSMTSSSTGERSRRGTGQGTDLGPSTRLG
ncbi:hypothetical protein GCM10027569_86890 [Flindersiella endophytica]